MAKKKIAKVISFPNGLTMVFDEDGKQMPEHQGKTVDVLEKLKRVTTPDKFHTAKTHIPNVSEYHGEYFVEVI